MTKLLIALLIALPLAAQWEASPTTSYSALNTWLDARVYFRVGTSVPATCVLGKEVYTDSGTNLPYWCSTTNTFARLALYSDLSGYSLTSHNHTGTYIATGGNAGTATALAANGSNCSAGSFPLGVDASGAAESCTAANSIALTLAQTALTTRGDLMVANTSTPVLGRLAKGTQYQVLTGGATDLTWGAVALDQATAISGILPSANGGTANAYFTVSGPATAAKTFTFPNASSTVLTSNAAVTVAQGGTGVGTLTGIVKGSGTSNFAAAASSDVIGLWTGTCNASTYLKGDGACGAPAGSGTVTVVSSGSLTSTALVTGGGTTTLQTPAATATMDSNGNISTPGSISSGVGSSAAGFLALGQGTAPSTGTTNVTLYAPSSVTSYTWRVPASAATGLYLGTATSTDVVISQVAQVTPALGGTGVANGANNTITFTGNYTLGVTLTGNTSVTFPTSGTLATTGSNISGTAAGLSATLAAGSGGTGVANTATLTLGSSNQNWATLGTGIVKNTTTTGAITNAAGSDVIGMWSGTCNSSTYLRGDGSCATPGGSGTVTSSGTPLIHQLAVWTTATDAKGIAVGATDKPLVGATGADPAFSKLTLTNPATSATLTVADGASLITSGAYGLTLTATATTNATLPAGTKTLLATDGSGASLTSLPSQAADSQTLTNKTLDAEGTGNSITIPAKIWMPAVGCAGTTGTLMWDTLAANAPTATCSAGSTETTMMRGTADFPDSDGAYSLQQTVMLPADWSGAIDAIVKYRTVQTSGNTVWQIATACRADAEVDDVAYNTASTATDAAKGTTLQLNDAAITGITATGCAAGELMHLKVFRDRTHASDSITGVISLVGVELTLRRAM